MIFPFRASVLGLIAFVLLLGGNNRVVSGSLLPTQRVALNNTISLSDTQFFPVNKVLAFAYRVTSPPDQAEQCSVAVGRKIEEWWHYAYELGTDVAQVGEEFLAEAAEKYAPGVANRIQEFGEKMKDTVESFSAFKVLFTEGKRSLETVSALISNELQKIEGRLKSEFGEEENVENGPPREKMVDRTLELVGVALVDVAKAVGANEVDVREHYAEVRPKIKQLLFHVGELVDEHPILIEVILIGGTMLVFPEAWIGRSLFRLVGFGPLGPVKGSMAAWAQARFWGGSVAKNSWFAVLQRAGMKTTWFGYFLLQVATVLGLRSLFCSLFT